MENLDNLDDLGDLSPLPLRRSPPIRYGSDEYHIHNYIIEIGPIPSTEVIQRAWGNFRGFYDERSLVTREDKTRYKILDNIYKAPRPNNLHFRSKKTAKKSPKNTKKSPKSTKKSPKKSKKKSTKKSKKSF